MKHNSASFRDPCGAVHEDDVAVYRTVAPRHAEEWAALRRCGLLAGMRGLIGFEELPPEQWPAGYPENTALLLRSQRLPFISYPYEWCFSQLREAALLTLDLQEKALEHGCTLKDASAYNVQFFQGKAIFIDLLSFERWKEGQPWQAYGQFCRHFLAPLALMTRTDVRCGLLSRQWIDGIPLDLASSLLPARTKLSPGLYMHIHLHASMQRKHADGRKAAEKVRRLRMDKTRMTDVVRSLRDTIQNLDPPSRMTEWGDYYDDTNYTPAARSAKEDIVRAAAAARPGKLAVDLGANRGEFSRLLAPHFALVLATDVDHTAVDSFWRTPPPPNVLPLLLDMASPSPSLGWRCGERLSFFARCHADLVCGLALCHHLRFTCGVPLPEIALAFADLCAEHGAALVEFVPRGDSQVERLLAGRDDVFEDYTEDHFREAFAQAGFTLEKRWNLPESERSLYLFTKEVSR